VFLFRPEHPGSALLFAVTCAFESVLRDHLDMSMGYLLQIQGAEFGQLYPRLVFVTEGPPPQQII
jgi:hypothetical protein